jgi:hypothetical protein
MLKRMLLAVFCALLLTGVTTSADVAATLILRSGERVTGDLADLNASGFIMRVDSGRTREVAPRDVAVIEFAPAGPRTPEMQNKLTAGQQFVVLKNGGTVDGKLVDVGGTQPLRLTIEMAGGAKRDLTSNEVGQIYMANPTPAAQAQAEAPAPAGATSNRMGTFSVAGNRAWTPTSITVGAGDLVAFKSSGQVRLSPAADDRVAPAGGGGKIGPSAPVPAASRGALLGKIGDGQPFVIGSDQSLRMSSAGTLHLGVNDDVVSDNGGEFQVSVTVLRRAAN